MKVDDAATLGARESKSGDVHPHCSKLVCPGKCQKAPSLHPARELPAVSGNLAQFRAVSWTVISHHQSAEAWSCAEVPRDAQRVRGLELPRTQFYIAMTSCVVCDRPQGKQASDRVPSLAAESLLIVPQTLLHC